MIGTIVTTFVEELKSIARQLEIPPGYAAALLLLVIGFGIYENPRTCERMDKAREVVAAELQHVSGCHCVNLSLNLAPDAPQEQDHIGLCWTANVSEDQPALSVTLLLPGYTGHFSTPSPQHTA